MTARPDLVVIRDTREQYEPAFGEGVRVETATLPFGDYSAKGITDLVALELKWSLEDLACCVGRERERFETMLAGLAGYPMRALIIASTPELVTAKWYRGAVRPAAVVASTWAWAADFGVPTVWARDRNGAARAVEWWLRRALRHADRLRASLAGGDAA